MTDYRKYINALRKCANEHDKDQTPTFNIVVSDLCRDTANLLEALEQESKTGHWIETHDDWGNGIITDRKYKCSVCHGKHIDPETGEWHEVFDYKYPFCPNCGAKMAETENT